jgi:hypothetical protein
MVVVQHSDRHLPVRRGHRSHVERSPLRQEFVPKSLQVLKKHLGEGDEVNPDAWRAALPILW